VVNFLVPRGQFLSSPLGQALLFNKPVANSGDTGPLLGDAQGAVGGSTVSALQCYWENSLDLSNSLCSGGVTPPSAFSTAKMVLDQENCASNPSSPNCAAGGVPSNPTIEGTDPAPSLQGVVTLNLSFVQNTGPDTEAPPTSAYLDALLAGLLDNSTDMGSGSVGINGTFKDVTSELPSLGLSPVVMKALSNQTQLSSGIFGAPTSFAQPQPPSPPGCPNFMGCLWNTVSGTISTLVSVLGTVWTGIVAAENYIANLAYGLANEVAKGAEWVAATTASIVATAASALEAALQALLAFVIKQITTLIDDALAPVENALANAVQPILTAFGVIETEISAKGTVTVAQVASYWNAFAGSLFLVGLVVSSAIATALVVVEGVSLGTGFLVGLLVSILITLVISKVMAIVPSSLSSFTSISAAAVHGLEGLINGTTPSQWTPPQIPTTSGLERSASQPCSYSATWDSFATTFGLLADALGLGVGEGFGFLAGSYFENIAKGVSPTGGSMTGAVVDFDIAFTVLTLDIAAGVEGSRGNTEWSLALAADSVIMGTFGLLHGLLQKPFTDPFLITLDRIATGIDVAGAAVGGAGVIVDLGLCPS
jgi:hypothetical protein